MYFQLFKKITYKNMNVFYIWLFFTFITETLCKNTESAIKILERIINQKLNSVIQ